MAFLESERNMKILIILYIPLILSIFIIIYPRYLKSKIKKKNNLIIDKSFLSKLFELSNNPIVASLGKNNEIDINDVIFIRDDFEIFIDLNLLEKDYE